MDEKNGADEDTIIFMPLEEIKQVEKLLDKLSEIQQELQKSADCMILIEKTNAT